MLPKDVPEVVFQEDNSSPIFPRPVPKMAVCVRVPRTQGGSEIPIFIRPEWARPGEPGDIQVFYGDFYGIINPQGDIAYGSARIQWEAMHSRISAYYWVKTVVPMAYQATEVCKIVTLIPDDSGNIKEAYYRLNVGDWVVRQPGGEVQHVKAEKFGGIYFSPEEARELGLTTMSQEAFAKWAIESVRAQALV